MFFKIIKSFFSIWGVLFKVIKIVAILAFLWFVFIYLNNKFGLLSPISSILKAVFKGIRGAFSLIGF